MYLICNDKNLNKTDCLRIILIYTFPFNSDIVHGDYIKHHVISLISVDVEPVNWKFAFEGKKWNDTPAR